MFLCSGGDRIQVNQYESECNDVLPVDIEILRKKSVCDTDIYGCKRYEQE